MKKILSTILSLLLITTLTITTADAGPGIKITSADFGLSSLTASGILKATGQRDVTIVLEAEGKCTITIQQTEPVSVEVAVSAAGKQFLQGNAELGTKKNTRRAFDVETTLQNQDRYEEICQNKQGAPDNFVLWDKATISVYSGDVSLCEVTDLCGDIGLTSSITATDISPLAQQVYNCKTNQDAYTVSCTPVKNNGSNGSNNGSGAICHATGNTKNPYVLIKVNPNGLNGHSRHAGDIIPAPADGCPN